MEENRLKPMGQYDPIIFNDIYKKTEKLRKKLASGIDYRRFGVDYYEVLSWFDVKFIYAFNKYHDQHNPEVLKGHIIRALQFFRCRVLRAAYTYDHTQNIVDLDAVSGFENVSYERDPHDENRELFRDLMLNFMQKHLSENAFELLQLQLDPPPYILKRLEELGIHNLNKIPNSVIVDYFELGTDERAVNYIDKLKKEIRNATSSAKEYFKDNSLRQIGTCTA